MATKYPKTIYLKYEGDPEEEYLLAGKPEELSQPDTRTKVALYHFVELCWLENKTIVVDFKVDE